MNFDFATVMLLLASVFSCFAWISKQLDGIKRQISEIDKNTVSHEHCRLHREKCPCVKECEELRKKIEEYERCQR